MKMRSLLALPLFQASMRGGDFQKALCYLGLGAAFGPKDLDTLQAAGIDVAHIEVPVQSFGQESVCWTLLHCACFFGHPEAAKSLLDRRSDIERHTTYGLAALHHATRNGHVEISSYLLEQRAQLVSKLGVNAMSAAAHQGYHEVVELLLTARANPNDASRGIRGAGSTRAPDRPLTVAASQGHHEVVEVLLRHGADIYKTACQDGQNALHVACQDNHTDVVQVLLKAEPQVLRRKTKRGHSAIDLAEAHGHLELADDLRNRLGSLAAPEEGEDVEFRLEEGASVSPRVDASRFSPSRSKTSMHSLPRSSAAHAHASSMSPPFSSPGSGCDSPTTKNQQNRRFASFLSSDQVGASKSSKPKRHW